MANQEHLDILKHGVEVWNQWRLEHPEIQPDLNGTDLRGTDLREADLSGADFRTANLSKANLREANLDKANLCSAKLNKTNLSKVKLTGAYLTRALLSGASLSKANLREANLDKANLSGVNLYRANLSRANLSETNLHMTIFNRTDLNETDLSYAFMILTIFGDVDLSVVKGLDVVKHRGPSTIGIDAIYRSRGAIPEVFLRGAGVPDSFITYARSLVNNPIDYYTCFISYSNKNEAFAKRLYADLQSNGVRCWFAPEDMKIGDKIRIRIDEAIRMYDKLLLVLSQDSIDSDWVEYEVEAALAKERVGKGAILFPIRLDNTVMESTTAWAAHLKNTRHIGDFEQWKNHDIYQGAFQRLLRDLKAQS